MTGKVLLVNPSSPFLIAEKVFPPLGLLWVGAALRNQGYAVEVLDLSDAHDHRERIRQAVTSGNPDAVGITATSAQFASAVAILRVIKEVQPRLRVLLGGPHATVQPQSAIKAGFDCVVLEEGVTGIFPALQGEGQVIQGARIEADLMPLPARDLIELESYHYNLPGTGTRATTIMSQFGCSFHCSFCCGRDLAWYRHVRFRSPGNVLLEMAHIKDRYGYHGFMFFDDEFNLNRQRTLAFCQALEGMGYQWRCFVKAELFTDDLAQAMSKAGCVEIGVGVESGSDRILKMIGKRSTAEINSRARKLAKEYGIRFKAFTVVGLPGETEQDVMLTKKWLIENKPDDLDVTVLVVYPGSPLYDSRYPHGGRHDFLLHRDSFDLDFPDLDLSLEGAFYKGARGEYRSYVRTSALPSAKIVALRDEVEKEARQALGLPLPIREG